MGQYLERLKSGDIPAPVLASADELFVAGWVKTKSFDLFLGDGQDAAGTLAYEMAPTSMTFSLTIESNDKSKQGLLRVDPSRLSSPTMRVEVNGAVVGSAPTNRAFVYSTLGDGDTLRLVPVPEPGAVVLSSAALLGCAAGATTRSGDRATDAKAGVPHKPQ